MHDPEAPKEAKFLRGAPDFRRTEGFVCEKVGNAGKATAGSTRFPVCAPSVLTQGVALRRDCVLCDYHIESLVNFIFDKIGIIENSQGA